MTMRSRTFTAALLCAAVLTLPMTGSAESHEGVMNEAVKSRMALMGEIAGATKVLGGMAQGKVAYNFDEAVAAKGKLRSASAQVANRFEEEETDPKSEALPAIWENYEDFSEKADALEIAASQIDVGSLETLRAGMQQIGASCGACHKLYRIEKD